jgi:hypothetical protein
METKEVYKAIATVTRALGKTGISKSRTNTAPGQGGYSFRGIDDIYNALSTELATASLCIIPRVIEREVVERQSKNGGALFYVTIRAEYDIVSAIDGSSHTASAYGEAMDSGDKATNKAMSAAYKYMAMQLFCIPTEGDNDADATTHEVAAFVPPAHTNGTSPAARPVGQSAARRDLMDRAMTLYGVMKEQGLKYKGKMFKDMTDAELSAAIATMEQQLEAVPETEF